MKEIKYSDKFMKVASVGAQMDIIRALFLLCDAYIDNCGISLGYRTAYYIAGEGWMKKLAHSQHELALDARLETLDHLFPAINDRYIPEEYDCYDIAPVDGAECVEIAEELMSDYPDDEELLQALCAGIMFCYQEDETMKFHDLFIGRFDTESEESYTAYQFNSELENNSDSIVKLHIFKLRGLKTNFHFIVDLTWFLATDEIRLLYQLDKDYELEEFDSSCYWTGYESLKESLVKCLAAPVNKFLLSFMDYENNLHYLINDCDDYAKETGVKTILERMRDIGLVPLKKYEKYLK